MRIQAIASGSNGNCFYIGSENTHILVDVGISAKRITDGVHALSVDPSELSGICITHEHSDHIQGLRVLSKKYHVPIYGTRGTLEAILRADAKGEIDSSLFRIIDREDHFQIGDLDMHSMPTSHDSAESCAYKAEAGGSTVALITDLGHYTKETVDFLQGVNGILLEANHDIRMLESGSYPYPLKRRILGDYGHLSNENSGRLLNEVLNDNLKIALLGHLSDENNLPELALLSVQNEVNLSDNAYRASDFDICVARRNESSRLYEV